MSTSQASNAFDLLGQANPAPPVVHLPGAVEPQLKVSWGAFRQSFSSNVSAAFTRTAESRKFLTASFFKDAWVEKKFPRRAVAAAALWHVLLFVLPAPQFSAPQVNHAFDNTILTWSGPIEDLPLLDMPGHKPKPTPRGDPAKPLPAEGADAFHPRQRIFTDPSHPNHPRQTLINPQAPQLVPDLLPRMPNIVQVAPNAMPARPRIEISERVLKSLKPKQRKAVATDVTAPAPDLQNNEVRPSDLALAANQSMPERPKLELNVGAAPRLATHKQEGETAAAPELNASQQTSNGAASTLIALSATPGPIAPAAPPQGNTAARIAITPEGKQRGVPGGTPNATSASNGGANGDRTSGGGSGAGSGSGKNDVGVSISGGNPTSNSSGLGGVKPKLDLSGAKPNASRAARETPAEEPPARTTPPNFADLAPGAKPEAIFSSKRVYTLHVNMPNLNSATGSWILNFSEFGGPGRHVAAADELVSPQPVRKVDPKYPPTLIAEHVEGEVVLYGVIRRDGSVDSIQLVKGIDEQLDENAKKAFAQWKFRPAEKQGELAEVEVIAHIPFRAPSER
ncbi:MAG: TonB family protein [Acidobacteria bacterium]|nr:TonB family protein [Acidobacteriota bacterium]MBS1864615.1 TonB family protein [Acidobacteriota bacterium]